MQQKGTQSALLKRDGEIRTEAASTDYDQKWGRFKPILRFNVDKSPLHFP